MLHCLSEADMDDDNNRVGVSDKCMNRVEKVRKGWIAGFSLLKV